MALPRVYGIGFEDGDKVRLLKAEESLDLTKPDGYYKSASDYLRITMRLLAHTFFKSSDDYNDSVEKKLLEVNNTTSGVIRTAVALNKEPQVSKSKLEETLDELNPALKDESDLQVTLDKWSKAESKSLLEAKARIEWESYWITIAEIVVFCIGFLIAIVDKRWGDGKNAKPISEKRRLVSCNFSQHRTQPITRLHNSSFCCIAASFEIAFGQMDWRQVLLSDIPPEIAR